MPILKRRTQTTFAEAQTALERAHARRGVSVATKAAGIAKAERQLESAHRREARRLKAKRKSR